MAKPTPPTNEFPTLSKTLGKWSAIAMMVGAVIGSGIFAKPAANAAASDSVSLIMVVWVTGGIITLVSAICMAELSLMMPKAGGTYVYIRQAYGRLPAFLSGWNESIFFQSTANSALAVYFTMTLGGVLEIELTTLQIIIIVLTLQMSLTIINCMGVYWGSFIQNITTIIKVSVLVGIALLPFVASLDDHNTFSASNFTDAKQSADSTNSMVQMLTAVMLSVMWAYSGGWMVTSVAEEIKEPEKNLSFALIGGALVLMVIYITVNISFHGIFSLDEMVAIKEDPLRDIPQEAVSAYLSPISLGLANFGKHLIEAIILVSALSALNTGFLTPPRVLFAMARDKMFLPSFGKVHPKTRAPYIAILGQGVTSMSVFLLVTCLVLFTGLGAEGNQGNRNLNTAHEIFDQLTNIAVFSSTIFVFMTLGAVFILRKREPNRERPYRIPGYPFLPAVALITNAVFLFLVAIDDLTLSAFSIGFLVLSIPLYYAFNRQEKKALSE